MAIPPLVEPAAALADAERARTARHTALSALGDEGQRRIAAASVAIVGAGGLGSPAVLALAAAGIGRITIIDDDRVELSNLQRQVMHRVSDVGAPKVESVHRVVKDLGSTTDVHTVAKRIVTVTDALEALRGADVVLDGTDTFATRSAVAGACEELRVPLIWGTVQGFDAQLTVLWNAPPSGQDPVTLADLHPPESVGEVPTCAEYGVLGALCIQAGAMMATEAIKLVTGIGDPLLGRVLVIDALGARQREVPLAPSAATGSVGAPAASAPTITADALASASDVLVIDVREPDETARGMITGAVNIPLERLLHDPAAVPLAARTVMVCASGARAERAATFLARDRDGVVVLEGGMRAWEAAGRVAPTQPLQSV